MTETIIQRTSARYIPLFVMSAYVLFERDYMATWSGIRLMRQMTGYKSTHHGTLGSICSLAESENIAPINRVY